MSQITITLLFLAFAIIMFMLEKIPLGVTSMIVCVGLVVTGVLDWQVAFSGFIDSNVILFVAMFIVGGALFETGMANKIGGVVTHLAKTERQLIVAIMVIVGAMSGFLSNTGTAAILIPVVIGIAAKSGYSRSRLLMPLVFAAAMGGNLSLIGAPGNMIAQSSMEKIGLKFGFFDYAKVGLPILIVGIIFFALFGYKFLPDKVDTSSEGIFDETKDFSNVPKWKQALSLIILILTLLGMIFEDQIGIKLCITGCIGALALILTGVISEKNALKSIDLKKYYPHPLHEGENTVILVTDEVANALERFIREENNDTLRRYRSKAYYSLDCENGIEHHILFREKTPEELYEKKLTMQQLNRALAKLPVKQSQHIYAHFFLGKSSREIATAENVSVRAVQKSVRAGLKRLGKILKND